MSRNGHLPTVSFGFRYGTPFTAPGSVPAAVLAAIAHDVTHGRLSGRDGQPEASLGTGGLSPRASSLKIESGDSHLG